MKIDTSVYYLLKSSFYDIPNIKASMPDWKVLEVYSEAMPEMPGRFPLGLENPRSYSGQYWEFVELPGGKYRLCSAYLGDDFALTFGSGPDGVPTPYLAENSDNLDQALTLTLQADNTYSINIGSKRLGVSKPRYYQELYQGAMRQALFIEPAIVGTETGNWVDTRWILIKASQFANKIPNLDLKGQTVEMTLGPTDYKTFKKPIGTVKAVMVFVDFMKRVSNPTGETGQTLAKNTADRLLGAGGKVQALYRTLSHRKLTLEVDVKSDLGWKQPGPSGNAPSNFNRTGSPEHRAYVDAAKGLFTSSEVDFSAYDFVFIVPPEGADFPGRSQAFTFKAQTGAASPSGKIRGAVTYGTTALYGTRPQPHLYTLSLHEVGHLFGLPDLYTFDEVQRTYPYPPGYTTAGVTDMAGCWSVMSETWHSERFLGWEQHKMGWLEPDQKLYHSGGTLGTNLHPLSDDSGVSIVVIPLDDPSKPSKVLVVESAQPFLEANETGPTHPDQGVLLYTVDAKIASGHCPIEILPKTISQSHVYGNLYEAPFKPGDPSKTFKTGDVSITVNSDPPQTDQDSKVLITVKVLEDAGSSHYGISVSVNRKQV